MITAFVKKPIRFFVIVIFVILILSGPSLAIEAEMIWSENIGHKNTIFLNRYHEGRWMAPESIAESERLSILPAIGSDGEGNRLALWVEIQNDNRSLLKYRFFKNQKWSSAETMPGQQNENLAPVVVYDAFRHPIVFWSSNDGENDDDIFMARWNANGWESPKRINDENDVPDILPQAGMDRESSVWLCWKHLTESNEYADSCRIIGQNGEIKETSRTDITAEIVSDTAQIEAPPFKFGKSRATIHFPGNRKNQSITIRDVVEE